MVGAKAKKKGRRRRRRRRRHKHALEYCLTLSNVNEISARLLMVIFSTDGLFDGEVELNFFGVS